ncbi:hypothetical protein PEDI_07830 [Persicobacter diffluens]|uniref:Uncharacterized protein n=1 Tax=Persicobacter diffluens TaxID=981 RepID=A0AAN4VUI9_9BACT|nr:hypothetical protein PEDI_07830 [Persicobacter diffluens]
MALIYTNYFEDGLGDALCRGVLPLQGLVLLNFLLYLLWVRGWVGVFFATNDANVHE